MANVKPGDRAVVISGVLPMNIGKIVLVIEQAFHGDRMRGGVKGLLNNPERELGWWVESLGTPFKYANHNGAVIGASQIAPVADKDLRRLVEPGQVSKFNHADELSTRKKEHAPA
jgi:hypothetical protein